MKWYHIALTLLTLSAVNAKNIFSDVHGVLLKEELEAHVKQVVKETIQAHQAEREERGLSSSRPYQLFCEMINNACPSCQFKSCKQRDIHHKFPHIIFDLFSGKVNTDHVHSALLQSLKLHPFEDEMDQVLVRGMINATFSRQQLLDSIVPINESFVIMQLISKNIFTTEKHNLFVLSNAPKEWIDFERERFPQVYGLFPDTQIITSAEIGDLKPTANAFNSALTRFNLKAAETMLLDDTRENVEGAQAIGMNACYFDYTNIEPTVDFLIEQGIFKPEHRDDILHAINQSRTPNRSIRSVLF